MLKSIRLNSLFGIYDYTLDLTPEQHLYKFITGPNGYGKSTILRLLNAVYSSNSEVLASVRFQSMELYYENQTRILIDQECSSVQEEGSDEYNSQDVTLKIRYQFQEYGEWKTNMIVSHSSEEPANSIETQDLGLYLFFHSHPLYYISDQRINSPTGEPAIQQCVAKMSDLLKDPEHGGIKDFGQRLDVFKSIIGEMEFAHKTLEVEARYGFRFISNDSDRTILNVDGLSSGEQHIVIQTFELLFEAPDDSLVLIDEPELSFHLAWQMLYLKNLKRIARLRKLQFIIATHSPQIFASQWNLSIDLYEQSRNL